MGQELSCCPPDEVLNKKGKEERECEDTEKHKTIKYNK